MDTTGVRFRHPLIRSAVYHGAPFARRAAAHRQLAGLLHDQPDRRAWHLAAASLTPDEGIASLLVATTAQAQGGGACAPRALTLERAAGLSPDLSVKARRLLAAAEAAVSTGQTSWARDLAARALALTDDQGLQSRCQHVTGWALAWGGHYSTAARTLLSLAGRLATTDADAAGDALGLAATAAYQAGDPDSIGGVADVLAVLPSPVVIEPQALGASGAAGLGAGRHRP